MVGIRARNAQVGIVLSIILVALPSIFAGPEIPSDASKIDSWYSETIKPAESRKGDLDPNLATAEASPVLIKVRQDGSGQFKTVQAALDSIKKENKVRQIIDIGPGKYKEKLKVERFKPYVTFLGDSKDKPTLTFDGTAAKYGTVDSASTIVESDYFVASNIIFENSAPRPTLETKLGQALALRLAGDFATIYNCKMLGFQDTLGDDKGSHFYKDCYIEGTVDFIFGGGKGLYLNCEIHVIPGDDMAMVTAQANNNAQDKGGYVIVHSKITGEGNKAVIGRSWMPAPKVMVLYTTLENAVDPVGWSDNRKPETDKTVIFGEFENKGPMADMSKRAPFVKKLTEADAKPYMTLEWLEGTKWLLPPPQAKGAAAAAGPGAAEGPGAAAGAPGEAAEAPGGASKAPSAAAGKAPSEAAGKAPSGAAAASKAPSASGDAKAAKA